MARTVIRRLVARDGTARVDVVIEPGAFIESCNIQRTTEGYAVDFVSGGRALRCALAEFQARTQTFSPALETAEARKAAVI